jgi:alpha-amylase
VNYNILLQAFHWDSPDVRRNDSARSPRWYRVIEENAVRIKNSGFTLVWFPPPSDSVEKHGYEPRELNKLDSEYGSESELRAAISKLSPVKAIADIVINHRSGSSSESDFTNPVWDDAQVVVDNDEGSGRKSMNTDTGNAAPFSRDLDHKSSIVSLGIKDWMNSLKSRVGFRGWRYDFVKGYAPWAIELYNRGTRPEFSVGEFFDGNLQAIINWIDSTHPDPSLRSMAFDFPLRDALYQAVVWRNYHWLKYIDKAPGLVGTWPDKAVTFLENHDTEDVRNKQYSSWFPGGDQMLQGYAYLLTHPGVPCIFWRDIYDSPQYFEDGINDLIRIRKEYGIHSESKLYIAVAAWGQVYGAYIQGDRGELAIKLGPSPWQPWGSKWDDPIRQLLRSGEDFAVWGDGGRFW